LSPGARGVRTYLGKRLLLIVPTLLGAASLVFFIMRVIPGDVALLIVGGDSGQVDQKQLAAVRQQLGLDQPLLVQFGAWLWGVLRFDFGTSLWTGQPVTEELLVRLPLSLQLALFATIVSVVIAIPLGMLAAIRQDTWVDYVVRVISIGGLAIPGFWVGILCILFLVIFFGWGPPLEFTPPWVDPWANFQQMVWPIVTVGYRFSAVTTRMTRSTVLEVLREDYIRTAWAKGLRDRAVVIRHALKNAMLPVITLIGTEFAFLIGGLVVTETVFTLNGIGRFVVDAVAHRDYPVVQALVFLIAFGFVIVNLLVDLTYAWFDPRIRYR
jgi:peptide/nickel transport system permease protein